MYSSLYDTHTPPPHVTPGQCHYIASPLLTAAQSWNNIIPTVIEIIYNSSSYSCVAAQGTILQAGWGSSLWATRGSLWGFKTFSKLLLYNAILKMISSLYFEVEEHRAEISEIETMMNILMVQFRHRRTKNFIGHVACLDIQTGKTW